MYTIEDVKTRLIDHLMSVNLSGTSMDELLLYVKSVVEADTLFKPDFKDALMEFVSKAPYNGFGCSLNKEVE